MHTFIFDIGKTNIKGAVLDDKGQTLWTSSSSNRSFVDPEMGLPCLDVEYIWAWLQSALKEAAQDCDISAINVSTHGACAVLLSRDNELLFPVMDYEVEHLHSENADYPRPDYAETQSPDLPGGLNLGRQLWWLKATYPERFDKLGTLLLYPQYWVWKLTGHAVTEVTSLGCHTDLWEPLNRKYSTLVNLLGIEPALPPIVNGFSSVGTVQPSLAKELGLSESCAVYPGIHDSNASLARYLASDLEAPFTVVSTGTWVIAMALGNLGDSLSEAHDMLTNVDVFGNPVPCARFMGGREFEKICCMADASTNDLVTLQDIETIVSDGVYALPPFETGSGPFMQAGRKGQIEGKIERNIEGKIKGQVISTVQSGASLATLYMALMIDYVLALLDARGPILFGSVSLKNPVLCQLLSQLRPDQPVYLSNDRASTVLGAWCMTRWDQPLPSSLGRFDMCEAAQINGLDDYRDVWRKRAGCGVP